VPYFAICYTNINECRAGLTSLGMSDVINVKKLINIRTTNTTFGILCKLRRNQSSGCENPEDILPKNKSQGI
jgi:hypothetical protein